jgi:hypothetical protein
VQRVTACSSTVRQISWQQVREFMMHLSGNESFEV